MAYYEIHGTLHGWNGAKGYTPPAPILDVVCDDCAPDVVPFDKTKPRGQQHWGTGWSWAPRYGAPCRHCGTAA